MWKCPKCDTMNQGTQCTVCGAPAKKQYLTSDRGEASVNAPDEVNGLHILAWAAAFSHILFFFLRILDVVHPDTGRVKVAMFTLNRFLSQWKEVLVDYSKISLVFNGMSVAFLLTAGVLTVVCIQKITRRDAHGLTPLLILANVSGMLPGLTFFIVFRAAAKMRSLYGLVTFTGLGKVEIAAALVGILSAVAACILSFRQTAALYEEPEEFDDFSEEEEPIIPEVPSAPEEKVIPEVVQEKKKPAVKEIDRKMQTRVYPAKTQKPPVPPSQPAEGCCTRCGRVLRPTSIYCNVCAKPVHKTS